MAGVGYLIQLLARALALTLALELAGALLCGIRAHEDLQVVVLAQAVTNPLVELACIGVGWQPGYALTSFPWLVVLVCELAAWIVEALLYRSAQVSRHPWCLSAALNALSFGTGLVLQALGLL